jgi:hypothetical protein
VQESINLPDAYLTNPRIRAPLYYNGFRLLGPVLRRMSVLDRLEAYVVLSASASLLLFCGGLLSRRAQTGWRPGSSRVP